MAVLEVSLLDQALLHDIRSNVADFMRRVATRYVTGPARLLDIAPQDHEGARPFFPEAVVVETLDINPTAGCTYTADICCRNDAIADNRFDFVVCTEVLEHVRQPFDAVAEIRRILRPGGLLFLSVPFNFRIHGPLPDCWRFTEHGLRVLLASFTIMELSSLEMAERPLMPVHYTVVAQKEAEQG